MAGTDTELVELIAEAKEVTKKEKPHKNEKTLRFKDAPWYNPGMHLVVGGVGGIGSWLAFFLARQEANLYLYDMDKIEAVNMAGQLYGNHQIGMNKTAAVMQNLIDFTSLQSHNITEMGEMKEDSMTADIMFSGFDNMKARKLMFEKWKEQETRELFIDGRMLAEQGQVYIVTKGKEVRYESTLFTDAEVKDQPCSYKATSHCAAIIAGIMVSMFNNYVANKKMGAAIRELPFKLAYQLDQMNFEMEDI